MQPERIEPALAVPAVALDGCCTQLNVVALTGGAVMVKTNRALSPSLVREKDCVAGVTCQPSGAASRNAPAA